MEAARAKTHMRASVVAAQAAWGGDGASQMLSNFVTEMDAVIEHAACVPPATSGPSHEDVMFSRIAALASPQPVASILNDPETQRRIAAIERGEKP
jgi:hypothetical protein